MREDESHVVPGPTEIINQQDVSGPIGCLVKEDMEYVWQAHATAPLLHGQSRHHAWVLILRNRCPMTVVHHADVVFCTVIRK